jgi:hypothetical protein
MFNKKTTLSQGAKQMLKLGKQEANKPAYGTTFSQGERGKSAIFYYTKQSPDQTVEIEN